MTCAFGHGCVRGIGAGAVAIASLLIAGTDAQDRSQAPTFRSTSDAVRLDVNVQRGGRPVSDLSAADFEVLDNGIAQSVVDITYERLPIDVSVALDVSRSVTGETLGRLQRAVTLLRSRLRPDDRLALTVFNQRVRRLFGLDDPTPALGATFASIAASGGTSLIDTLMVMLARPLPADRRQLVIAFSDALDTSSVTEPDVALDVARRTTPTITLVRPIRVVTLLAGGTGVTSAAQQSMDSMMPSGPATRTTRASMAAIFLQLALETGGRVIQPAQDDTLTATFSQVLDEFRASYALSFIPTGVKTAGLHQLQVKVKRRGDFEIRARKSYVVD